MDSRRRGGDSPDGDCEGDRSGDRIWRCMDGDRAWSLAGDPSNDGDSFSGTFSGSRLFRMAVSGEAGGKKVQDCILTFPDGGISDLALSGR